MPTYYTPTIPKDAIIQSSKTGKTLRCYSVSSIYLGNSNNLIGFEYSFWDDINKKSKTIKQQKLIEMLKGVWVIKN